MFVHNLNRQLSYRSVSFAKLRILLWVGQWSRATIDLKWENIICRPTILYLLSFRLFVNSESNSSSTTPSPESSGPEASLASGNTAAASSSSDSVFITANWRTSHRETWAGIFEKWQEAQERSVGTYAFPWLKIEVCPRHSWSFHTRILILHLWCPCFSCLLFVSHSCSRPLLPHYLSPLRPH